MGVCPNCKEKLRLTDWKQECPHCGVNLMFYDFENKFYNDAKKAELSLAKVRVNARKAKTAYIGNKFAIIRLATFLLPLVLMLIPFSTLHVSLPYMENDLSLGILGVFQMNSDGVLPIISKLVGSSVYGKLFTIFASSLISFLVTALCAALVFLLTALCLISIKKMAGILCVVNAVGFVGCISSVVTGYMLNSEAKTLGSEILSGHVGFGAFLCAAAFLFVFIVNFNICRHGIPIEFEEGDLERVAIAKKVKKGELKIEDLPQPIVETAKTRALDDEIAKEALLGNENAGTEEATDSE